MVAYNIDIKIRALRTVLEDGEKEKEVDKPPVLEKWEREKSVHHWTLIAKAKSTFSPISEEFFNAKI